MHLTPAEKDRLTVFTVAELARRRLARGRRLSAPEAIAVISDEIYEAAWDGHSMDETVSRARAVLSADDVQPGVVALVRRVEVDALFPSGTALVAVDDPLGTPGEDAPGGYELRAEPVELNPGRRRAELTITNGSDAPIHVSSHFPVAQANEALRMDREAAAGMRLDIAAGTSLGWAPGESRRVGLVELAGAGRSARFLLGEPAEPEDPRDPAASGATP